MFFGSSLASFLLNQRTTGEMKQTKTQSARGNKRAKRLVREEIWKSEIYTTNRRKNLMSQNKLDKYRNGKTKIQETMDRLEMCEEN